MVCPDCVRGSILDGTPSGTVNNVDGVDAYLVSGTGPERTSNTFSVVLLTDAFGLEVVNTKLIADKIANLLACDVWVPDLFDGQPMMKPDGMEAQLVPDHPGPWPVWDQLRLYARVVWNIRVWYRARPSVVVPRVAKFIETLREKNKYDKLGVVGYCIGGGIAARLVPFKCVDSIVLCHPSMLTNTLIEAIDVPTAWACSEQDMALSQSMRLKAEATFATRKGKANFVPYEFVDYKGTVHGFACRPNLAYNEIKAAFEGSLSQTVEWFRKTLES